MIMRTIYEVSTVADLRPIMQALFPDVDNRDDPKHPEHPMTAVGLVLMSAVVLSTTETAKLALFAGYSSAFVSAITFNMENNQLWVQGRYDASTWLSSDGTIDADRLWDHVLFGCGELWMAESYSDVAADPCPCGIYWDERGGLARSARIPSNVNLN